MMLRIALECSPVQPRRRQIGCEQRRPSPLRFVHRGVAMHLHRDRGDLAHAIGTRKKLSNVGGMPRGTRLMADLDHVTAVVFSYGRASAWLANRQRHGFFEIDVLARDRIAKLLRVKMLRRGDDYQRPRGNLPADCGNRDGWRR